MILVLVLVLPRMGSGGLSCLAGFARFSDPMFESLSVSVCCGCRVCAGGWLLATVSSTCGPKERLLLSGGGSWISGGAVVCVGGGDCSTVDVIWTRFLRMLLFGV